MRFPRGPRWFGTKLMLLVLAAIGATLVIDLAVAIPMQFFRLKRMTVDNLATHAEVIAMHSTAALSFNDPAAGAETLAALRAVPQVTAAVIYDRGGRRFATYRGPGDAATAAQPELPELPPPPARPDEAGPRLSGNRLVMTQPIVHQQERLGTLVVVHDMSVVYRALWREVLLMILVGLAAAAVATGLALRMRRGLARPIAELAGSAQRVSTTGDYSVRARQYGDDELGQLTAVFNQMLERIELQGDQIQSVNRELRQRNHEMEQFVYTVSHDLKSPLVTITGFVGLLRQDIEAGRTEDVLEAADHLTRASTKMSELIDDLLQLSRIGRVPNEVERIDVAALVREVAEDLESRLHGAGARLEIQEDMPAALADRLRLTQVFDNLLTNAIKYGCGGENPVIRVGGARAGDEVRFSVADNGEGIAAEYHGKIFGLFQRLESRAEGTGVGLAIVARIVESHGGRVWVESTPGQGATFWIALPSRPIG